jgi:hypothetical protein
MESLSECTRLNLDSTITIKIDVGYCSIDHVSNEDVDASFCFSFRVLMM